MGKKRLPFVLVYVGLCLCYFLVKETTAAPALRRCAKVLPILLLLAGTICTIVRTRDRRLITMALALIFSAAGDVSRSFMSMMGFFAVAQIFYIISFARDFSVHRGRQTAALAVWAAMGTGVLVLLLSTLIAQGREISLIVAGSIYLILLLGMSFTAIGRSGPEWIPIAAGSLLFVISDSTIAIGRYVTDIPFSGLIVMITYYAAQLLLNIRTSCRT